MQTALQIFCILCPSRTAITLKSLTVPQKASKIPSKIQASKPQASKILKSKTRQWNFCFLLLTIVLFCRIKMYSYGYVVFYIFKVLLRAFSIRVPRLGPNYYNGLRNSGPWRYFPAQILALWMHDSLTRLELANWCWVVLCMLHIWKPFFAQSPTLALQGSVVVATAWTAPMYSGVNSLAACWWSGSLRKYVKNEVMKMCLKRECLDVHYRIDGEKKWRKMTRGLKSCISVELTATRKFINLYSVTQQFTDEDEIFSLLLRSPKIVFWVFRETLAKRHTHFTQGSPYCGEDISGEYADIEWVYTM